MMFMDGSFAPFELRTRRFSSADVQRMLETGIIEEGEKLELIGGRLLEMAPQGPLRWCYTQKLVEWLFRRLPEDLTLASQGPLRLGFEDEPEPEIFIFPAGMDVNEVRGHHVRLAIEVAVSSFKFDSTVKRDLYARFGVAEYWIISPETRRTYVYRLDPASGYGTPEQVGFDAPLELAGLSLLLAELFPAQENGSGS